MRIFSPLQKIADGRSILSILNDLFIKQNHKYIIMIVNLKRANIYDYSNIYDSLYLISIEPFTIISTIYYVCCSLQIF